MIVSRVEGLAATFWDRAGGRAGFGSPVDIASAACRALPLSVVPIRNLDTAAIRGFLNRIGADPWFEGSQRGLRGCLVADGGYGLVFVEANDPEEEQRLTVGHEAAHFIVHYAAPREKAVATLGLAISSVLDRTRPPTFGERLSSTLRDVSIEPFAHAMDKGSPRYAGRIGRMEDEADDLGIELIAPWREVQSMDMLSPAAIRERFGVPPLVAAYLADRAAPPRTSVGVLGIFGKK